MHKFIVINECNALSHLKTSDVIVL